MTSWSEVQAAVPELAAGARRFFDARAHNVMATVRADGSPRMSSTEIVFTGDEPWFAGMSGARRGDDPRPARRSG